MKTSPRLGLAVALALACAAPASFTAAAEPAPPKSITVPIKNFAFMAMSVTVAAGGSVTWKNLDGEPHTVVSTDGLFRSGGLDEGDSFTFKFQKPGVYTYICSIHPQMKASVVVR
jgi:plastocyanin